MQRSRRSPWTRVVSPLREFLRTEASGGVFLVFASLAALVWANSPWRHGYERVWRSRLGIEIAGHGLTLDLQHWVNDGLMTIFFLVVGLEIKRELTSGHLTGRRAASLPVAAALGGMVIPAALYLVVAGGTAPKGWGVPMATDIALAVGVLTLAGRAVPASVRAYLLGLAVVDDVGAIVVIAIFYSTGVAVGWLFAAVAAVVTTVVVRRWGVHHMIVYIVLGSFVWFALHEGGVHPTIAGVAMGLLTPVTPRAPGAKTTVEWLEHVLHPWSSFVIVPVFALANAGVVVTSSTLRAAWGSPITWGIIVGLVVGKPIGVLLATRFTVRSGMADPPTGATRRQMLGVGNAAGIGFTVALFIAELAFKDANGVVDAAEVADAKMAILFASIVSGALAFAVLRQRRVVAPTKLS